ncbi:hypothetical protein [Candidatus Stoquefichus massiliensis]|uniref:hypothetical protein n=1 Tax=Candidatus Stoquefichus massiliensis TaxID=1470350 RepID=UPI00047F3B2E|nr:hypothetical protein [Candidatus Stoquefichus massiliensis]
MRKIIIRIRDFLKYLLTPFLQNHKRIHFIVLAYNIFICFISFCLNDFHVSWITFVMIFLSFYLIWAISTVVMYVQTVERPDPLVKSSIWLKPGRYVSWGFGNIEFVREMRTSPVDDFYYIVMVGVFIFLPILFFQSFIDKDFMTLNFANGLVVICLSILRESLRLENEYVKNMEKAKIIFVRNQGCKEILKNNEEYQRYQVSRTYEKKWNDELEELKK